MRNTKYIIGLTMVLCACSSIQPTEAGQKVMASTNPAPKGCKYLGQVSGNQGNFFTGDWTSNKNLEEGSMNDLRNNAAELGANYVQLLTNRAGSTGSWVNGSGSMDQTNVTNLGNAYNCPEAALSGS